MTDNDFRAAIDVQIVRWQFQQIVRREFEQSDVPTGLVATEREAYPPGSASRLLAPTDDGTPTVQSGPVNTGDQ